MPLPGGQTTPHTHPVYAPPAPVPAIPAPPTVTPAPGLDPGNSRLPSGAVPVIGGGGGGVGPYRYAPPVHVSPAPVPFPIATLPYHPPVVQIPGAGPNDPGFTPPIDYGGGGGGGLPPSAIPGLPGAQLDLSKIPPVVWLVGLVLLLRR